ncbi:MAG: ABC transporter permease [Pirellulales bacterium]
MRPYSAILTDSFREALASRVLWTLLLVTTFLLAALAGFTLDERAAATISGGELRAPRELARRLRAADANSPAGRVWRLFPEETRAKIGRQLEEPAEQESLGALVAAFNRLLTERDLPGETAWPYERLNDEGRELRSTATAGLPADELARYNRLLLEAAFPEAIAPGRERELYVAFYGLEVPVGSMPLLRRDFLIRTAVGTISSFFLGYLGLFAGIIVTASVIPQTFEPGAIDLLLSKPVSRTGVYLSKFCGGCMFVLLNTAFLLGGLWLLVGLRHGVWIGSLPLCIPVFLFWFMVFYSVSALVGLIWRNAIVAITATIALWGFCALLSFVKNQVVEALILDPERLTIIVPSEKELFAAADTGQVYRWNEAAEHWDEILIPDDPRRWRAAGTGLPAGPLVDPTDGRVLTVQRTGRRWGGLFAGTSPLVHGLPNDRYRREEVAIAPTVRNSWPATARAASWRSA